MHSTVSCWTRYGYQYCSENEVCCSSGTYEYCCWDTSTVDSGVGLAAIMAMVGSFVFVTFITLLVIKCMCCKNRGQPGRITDRVHRGISNRTHPAVHVEPHYHLHPAAAVREHVPRGQLFVSPPIKSPKPDQRWPGAPPPYPGSPPTHGAHNTGVTNQSQQYHNHIRPHPPYPSPNHITPPYPPQGPTQQSAPPLGFDQMVSAPPSEMAPPLGSAHGNVPPPFDYIPPKSDLYR